VPTWRAACTTAPRTTRILTRSTSRFPFSGHRTGGRYGLQQIGSQIELRQIMTQYRFRHLPVVADGRLVGIVSIGDVVKSTIDELETEREHLLGVSGAILLIITAWALFRPGRAEPWLSPEEELDARRLLAEYGEQDSLGY